MPTFNSTFNLILNLIQFDSSWCKLLPFETKYFTLVCFCSKKDVELLTKVIHTIVLLLNDANVMVVKKVMLCLTQLYRLMLQVRWRI